MWGGFPKVIKKVFPNAKIIIDRFHVMKVVNKDLNKLRRAAGITDRQSKYLLLSNRINLNPLQIDKLEMALGKSECWRIAYEMKEKFREIYPTFRTPTGTRIEGAKVNHPRPSVSKNTQLFWWRSVKDQVYDRSVTDRIRENALIAIALG